MDEYEMKVINFSALKNRPIAVSLGTIGSVFAVMVILIKPIIIETLSADFMLRAEFVVVNTKLDMLIRADARKDAYSIIDAIEGDIKRHNKLRNGENAAWLEISQRNENRLRTAIENKDCILDDKPNCGDIKDEIW